MPIFLFYQILHILSIASTLEAVKLIVGLGNPEEKYARTRHNIGFRVIDNYAAQLSATFQPKSKFKALVAEAQAGDAKVMLAKPTTYYNLSGEAVRALADFYKIASEDILVVHDDIALPFGTLRAREKGSDAGNNGMKSVIQHTGPTVKRIRVGTANDKLDCMDTADFVLAKFTLKESLELKDVFKKTGHIIDRFVAGSFETTTL